MNKVQKLYASFFASRTAPLLLICLVSLMVSTKGITNEETIEVAGDMPRHAMNGVYFYDFARDLPLTHVIQYTSQYFSRYPALSLGHHPILPAISEVPFYAIFGVSVFSARLTTIFFAVLAASIWFLLISSLYDRTIALLSSLLLITSPYIVHLSRIVMGELQTIALIVLSFYFLHLYSKLNRRRYAVGFLFASVLSVYSKQTSLFMFPLYLTYFVLMTGRERIFARETFFLFGMILLLVSPIIPFTYKFSQVNVNHTKIAMAQLVDKSIISHGSILLNRAWYILRVHLTAHLSFPVLILSLIAIFSSFFRKRKREMLIFSWIVFLFMLFVFTAAPSSRHTVYWIPGFCLLASTLIHASNSRFWRHCVLFTLVLAFGYQVALAFQRDPEYARGYEEAARYVVQNWKGDSVLYASSVDKGFFIFFIRKHNQHESAVVLRANKVLATSAMRRIVEDLVESPEQLYDVLEKFGVCYVVIEDLAFDSESLNLLRKQVKTDRFVLRKKIPIRSNYKRLENVPLAIYEYKGYTRARPDAVLEMHIPLIGESIKVRFEDLLRKDGL